MSDPSTQTPSIAIFASGCFWARTEHIFLKHFSHLKTSVGYTGGRAELEEPRLPQRVQWRDGACRGRAHRVRCREDGYAELLEFFYRSHDPTTVVRQGGDVGTQYRSLIFTTTPEQAAIARRVTEEVQAKHFPLNGATIVSEINEVGPWWDAEAYHQLYLLKNPTGYQCPTHRLHW